MDSPITLALAQAVDSLPRGPDLAFEPKFDGHRTTLERTPTSVIVRSKANRIVTSSWMDLAVAAMDLEPGVLLDGEAVIYRNGVLDFGAVQQRAAAGAARAAALIRSLPASYAAFDILRDVGGIDVTRRPYRERRARLVELLTPLGPPLQPVPMTEDPEEALTWYAGLRPIGIEGLCIKRLDGAYPAGRRTGGWWKLRHHDTIDCPVVGHTGTRAHPLALVVRLPDGTLAFSRRITAPVRVDVAAHLKDDDPQPSTRTEKGERYTPCAPGLLVEVEAGTTRHPTVVVTRVRD
ncbi:ATP-dependent DNA ligase [Streptomyces sp. NPDC087440]|uniref:ATP-dependent DNA ligase n=1 Tax=Streptomyces sp. NPDC087440 TaxID=3365790 RepID=UPI003802A1F0